ncbi:MAG: AmmeMemoRadiSam system protein B, partial [Methanosphaera sp. rholeuAM74]
LELAKNLAVSIRSVEEKLGRDCIIVASSDLTHYEDADTAKYLDEKILKSVEDMDIDSLINNIVEYDITMCGYGPVITAIQYSKLLDNHTSHVLNYSHSGMVSGDYDSVVGYTSAIIKK